MRLLSRGGGYYPLLCLESHFDDVFSSINRLFSDHISCNDDRGINKSHSATIVLVGVLVWMRLLEHELRSTTFSRICIH